MLLDFCFFFHKEYLYSYDKISIIIFSFFVITCLVYYMSEAEGVLPNNQDSSQNVQNAEKKNDNKQNNKGKKQMKKEKQQNNEGSDVNQQNKKGKNEKQQKSNDKKAASRRADLTLASSKSNFAEWFEEVMESAEIVDKHWDIKGMPIFCSYGYTMHNAIMKLFEEEYSKLGIKLCQFPAFIPRSFLELEKDHVKGFESECFWHKREMCLRPTSETAMYHMFARWVKTLDDLPCMVQQSCNVYRFETKSTKPLIRVREIPWNEAHTAHATRDEALEYLSEYWVIVKKVLTDQLSIDGLRLRRPDWDRFPGAEFTDVLDVVMPCGRVLQTIGAHYLGQHFSKVFDIKVGNEYSYMTCIGVSTRALAATLSAHGDDRGLIVPTIIAPIQCVVIPIHSKTNQDQVNNKAEEIVIMLKQAGIRTFLDADSTKSMGEKFYYWEMKGVPLRIDLGAKEVSENRCKIVIRGISDKREVNLSNIVSECSSSLSAYDIALRERAQAHLQSRIVDVVDPNQLTVILENGGFARIPYWTMSKEGKEGAERVHAICGGEIRGYRPLEQQPGEGIKCCITGKDAKYWAYVARAY